MNGKQGEYGKQVWNASKDVILSTKTMMLLVNEGTGNIETFSNASSQVAVDTKQLIVLMFNGNDPHSPVFTQQFLFDATKALKTYILNLIKSSKDCVLNPNDTELRSTLDIWCRRVGEVLKDIMVAVQPTMPQPPHPAPAPVMPIQTTSTNQITATIHQVTIPNLHQTNINATASTTTVTDTEDLSNTESDTSAKNTLDMDEDNDEGTNGEFSGAEEEEELDFVVSALNVFNALEDLRGVVLRGFSSKRFNKASHVVLSSTATLLDVSQNMNLVISTPRLRASLESLVAQIRQMQAGPLLQDTTMGKLETCVRELEEAVGECVDEFRSASNPFDVSSMIPPPTIRDTPATITSTSATSTLDLRSGEPPPSPRRTPISRDDSFRETADKKAVFGLPLDIVMKNQKGQYPSLLVPIFFRDAVTYLRREGLECVGLFKAQSLPAKVTVLVNKINAGQRLDFGGPDSDAYTTANLIKKFLASLPSPLCSGKSKTIGGGTTAQEVQALVQSLPAVNQHVLCELCALMHQLSLHSQFNMMPTEALATAIGPHLFFPGSNSSSAFAPWQTHAHVVICIMIERFQEVFKQYPSRSDYPMSRSASDITPKTSAIPAIPPASTFSTPPLRSKPPPTAVSKKKYLPRLPRSAPRRTPTLPYKICVVGETGVGKTALIHRLLNDEFLDYHEPSVEQLFEKTLVLSGDVHSVEMMDTSGRHDDKLAYQKWFTWGEGFIITIDITAHESFAQVQYWMDEINKFRSDPYPFMLVGSHMDGELNRECPRDTVENFLKHFDAEYVEYSAKFPAPNIHRILTIIINAIQQNRKQQLELEKMKTPTTKKSTHGVTRSKHHHHHHHEAKPKRAESDPQLLSLDDHSNHVPPNSHKGFLLKWKEKRRKPVSLGVTDTWSSRPMISEAWINVGSSLQTVQEKALAQLALPSANGSGNGATKELISMDCLSQGFNVELSRESVTTLYEEAPLNSVVDPISRYYLSNFVGKEHTNYVGEETSEDGGKVVISFLLSPANLSSLSVTNGDDSEWSKAIIRTKKEDHRVLVPFASRKDMLKAVAKAVPSLHVGKLQEVKESSFVDLLVKFEETMGLQPRYKFGVLLCLDGQNDENQMFGNKDSTPELEQFMSMLGDKITLQGWNKFKGGLDIKANSTGTHSYFTEFKGNEIMFHVSTLLPYQDDDVQRVERKRHIGNDIVTIIFKSGNDSFSPTWLNTKFTHIFCVVSLDRTDERGTPHYRMAIANKPDIQPYPPFFLPNCPTTFEGGSKFREFLLSKLINGERAALRSPEFRTKLTRTRKSMLQELADKVGK
eukprot:Phypoly_transcript_00141.p1 GENE.Phypoly_transcript_00141~~Phypoly_transcript_00141.p1  ORF type:complete len:1306 (+),score=201.35 Phypoly_transcript_00141:2561-6478(+)